MAKRKPPRHSNEGHGPKGPQPRPAGRPRAKDGAGDRAKDGSGPVWLFGTHAVLAALANPGRRGHRLLVTAEAEQRHGQRLRAAHQAGVGLPVPERVSRDQIAQVLPAEAVHQGLAFLTDRLGQPELAEILTAALARAPEPAADGRPRPVILVLDQVTDPHNAGAIIRSAAAFGAAAVVAQARHAAPESGTLAKAASGALEAVPYVAVTNLSRALAQAKAAGFWILGLAGEAERTLRAADPGGPLVLVLGAEGPGLRRLTRESCDLIARLPTRPPLDSLNVSAAAAVALYALMAD